MNTLWWKQTFARWDQTRSISSQPLGGTLRSTACLSS